MEDLIYKSYADAVKNALVNGKKRGELKKGMQTESFSNFSGTQALSGLPSYDEKQDLNLFNSLEKLSDIAGKKAKPHEAPGAHPDFSYLKNTNATENHYITSMFIDIKNSTGLFRKYYPITVANITTTIQKAAIHTCWYFDGYVQRFHGDGLFVYFGGKNMTQEQSVKNAINAASFFSYFIQNDLKNLFSEQGVEKIYTRIGIDTGKAEDVVWHLAGMKDCSEITTCSLHTSLASKMQSNAKSNGIMLGDNVKDNSSVSHEHFTIRVDPITGKEDRYIFQIPEESFNYTQWEFNWERYLRKHPGIVADNNGNLYFKKPTVNIPNSNLNLDYLRSQTQGYKPSFNG